MKQKLLLLLLTMMLAAITSQAQVKSNLVFFTEQGERFTVILNGIRQNQQPETNVKITGLIAPNYKLKIIFDDASLGEIDKNLMFNQGTESTFVIKRNNKNEYVVRWMNDVPLAQALPPSPGQQVVVFTTQAAPTPATVTQTTTTVTESYSQPQQAGVSMGINVNDPELGVNFNVNMNAAGTNSNSQVTTTQTTTYTSTTTTGGYYDTDDDDHHHSNQANSNRYSMPGYKGRIGCPYPMMPDEFNRVKQSIASKSFDDTRLTIAKQVISANCLLCDQVKEIMLLFSFEDTRLDLAKYAYGYTYDLGNYYKLNDAFTFESSIEELNDYINGFRR